MTFPSSVLRRTLAATAVAATTALAVLTGAGAAQAEDLDTGAAVRADLATAAAAIAPADLAAMIDRVERDLSALLTPVRAQATLPGGVSATAEGTATPGDYELVLTVGATPANGVIQVVRDLTHLGLNEARDLVEPISPLLRLIDPAEVVRVKLTSANESIEIK